MIERDPTFYVEPLTGRVLLRYGYGRTWFAGWYAALANWGNWLAMDDTQDRPIRVRIWAPEE